MWSQCQGRIAPRYVTTSDMVFPRSSAHTLVAHVDPLGASDCRHAQRIDDDGAVRRATTGHHDIEALQLQIAIDRQRRYQPEGTHATRHVTRENGGLLGRHEARLATEDDLGLGVVDPGVTAGHQDDILSIGDPQDEALGNLRRLDPKCCGEPARLTRAIKDHHDHIRRVLSQECPNALDTHVSAGNAIAYRAGVLYCQHLGGFARREQLDRGEWDRTARWLD